MMADWEVENARLLVEQAWAEFKPAYDAMVLFFGSYYVSPDTGNSLAGTELVRCDNCWMPLYRRRGWQTVVLTAEEERENKRVGGVVSFVVDQARQFVCCSNRCAADVFAKAGPNEHRGGYPL